MCISESQTETVKRSRMTRFEVPVLAAALLILTLALGVSRSASQNAGFYSINCGGEAYSDPVTQIIWKADPFNTSDNELLYGRNTTVSSSLKNITNVMRSLRYFPNDGRRNRKFCYSFLVPSGDTYLLRASFLYGNYDGLNQPPKFVLLLNYDKWTSVTTSTSTTPIMHELTFNFNDNELNICLAPDLNSNDTPFISTLEIRNLNTTIYASSNALFNGFGLMLWRRINYGARTKSAIRYPDDPYDRIWEADTRGPVVSINSSQVSLNYANDSAEPPAEVMATAITSTDPTANLSFTYEGYGGDGGFRIEMHFEELDPQPASPRNFGFAFPNSELILKHSTGFVPPTIPRSVFLDLQIELPLNTQIVLLPANASRRGPLLNAIELFHWTPQQLTVNGTFQDDVEIIKIIQGHFKLIGYGQGDPCMPEGYTWTWITCYMDIQPRIIGINLANFNLTGDIPSSINNLTNLKNIDLSNNNLSGKIPNINNLLELEYLDLHNNNLTGELPSSLISLPKLVKIDVSYNKLCGNSPSFLPTINYTHIGNNQPCNSSLESNFSSTPNQPRRSENRKKYIVSLSALAALYVVSTLTLFIIYMARQHYKTKEKKARPTTIKKKQGFGDLEGLPFTSKMFTYKEISDATLNFTTILGEGGFGKVYRGLLPSGEAVAVKMLTDVSKQGLKEFYNEVAILSRVRHKNLVSLIGYCVENTYMLIYEYIAKGNLQDLIYGEVECTDKPLPWKTRLHIALDASQGLEYLHMGCDPTIIHRDVKSSNILLSEKMQAKVADFGLSRLKEGDNTTSHVSTINVVGTVGYLDPAYNATNQLTDKSDVYSFGIVLFELICGRAPIRVFDVPSHIVDWALQSHVQGKVKEIVDPMLANGYKMESMQKVLDLAFGCVENDRMKRPKMSEVYQILQNALEIEMVDGNDL